MHGLGNDYIYVNCYEEKVNNHAGLTGPAVTVFEGVWPI